MTMTHTSTSLAAGKSGIKPLIWLALALWALAVWSAGAAGVFAPAPAGPPLALLAALILPVVLFAAGWWASAAVRAWALGLDLRLLTALQGWRVIGAGFLFLYAQGSLPGIFAWPAGLGDLLVGLAAPFVLLAVIHKTAGWQSRVRWLNIAGLIDFAGAFATGLLTSPSSFGVLAGSVTTEILAEPPLIMIPGFAVPLFIILHVISLLQVSRMGNRAD